MGERVLIVGGTGSLVEAGILLLRRGHRVALLGRSAAGIERAARRLREAGADAPLLRADARDAEALAQAVRGLARGWDGLDVVVYNVGPPLPAHRDWDAAAIAAYLAEGAVPFANLCTALRPLWRQRAGQVVLPLGHLAFAPQAAPPAYAAWYGARDLLLRRLAEELPGLRWTYVLLGRLGSRWLTHGEIAAAVARAVEQRPVRLEVGAP